MDDQKTSNFAFEVDLEKMEGKFLFDTGEVLQTEAEKILLERCRYKHIAVSTIEGEKLENSVELNSSRVAGLCPEGVIVPFGETLTTQLVTESGFICQVNPHYWRGSINCGKTIYVVTSGENYPIKVVNSFFDV